MNISDDAWYRLVAERAGKKSLNAYDAEFAFLTRMNAITAYELKQHKTPSPYTDIVQKAAWEITQESLLPKRQAI